MTRVSFHISLTEIAPYMETNGVKSANTYAEVAEGSTMKLWAEPVSSATGGTFLWGDGSTKDTLIITDIRKSNLYTVTYTSPAGKESKATWQIDVTVLNNLAEGEYYFLNASTGMYYTNPCLNYTTDDSEVMTFEVFNEEDPAVQIWNFEIDGTTGRYKITSKKDSRFLNEHGVLRNRAYYPEWNTYNLTHLTGSDQYAIQNGGSGGSGYWFPNTSNGITGQGPSERTGFPFLLIPVDQDTGVGIMETLDIHLWQNAETGEVTFTTPLPGTFFLISLEGTLISQIDCQEGVNQILLSDLAPGIFIGVLQTSKGKQSFKILRK